MRLDRRNKILLLGSVLVLYLSYAFAISKTLESYNEYSAKSDILKSGKNAPSRIKQLQQQEMQLDRILTQYKISEPISFQNDLLKEINTYCSQYHLKIVDFKEPHII